MHFSVQYEVEYRNMHALYDQLQLVLQSFTTKRQLKFVYIANIIKNIPKNIQKKIINE